MGLDDARRRIERETEQRAAAEKAAAEHASSRQALLQQGRGQINTIDPLVQRLMDSILRRKAKAIDAVRRRRKDRVKSTPVTDRLEKVVVDLGGYTLQVYLRPGFWVEYKLGGEAILTRLPFPGGGGTYSLVMTIPTRRWELTLSTSRDLGDGRSFGGTSTLIWNDIAKPFVPLREQDVCGYKEIVEQMVVAYLDFFGIPHSEVIG